MPHTTDTTDDSGSQPAALAALAISESLILTLVESGALDPQAARRCLLDAAAACDCAGRRESGSTVAGQAAELIDDLLRQVEAASPSSTSRAEASKLLPRPL
jgi:hypothetical protein